ncbi:TPA: radical SAM protein [Candidatus Bathyarchaeota archaeon]|nr:radical SAM protein [Candidatus Bathyarchaeota archaeon]
MRVLLINPPAPSVESFSNAGINAPPLGLAYIASVLEEGGHEVEVLDCQALELSLEGVKREMEARRPEVVGVTSTTPTIHSALEIVRAAKEVDRSVVTIVGGPHASFTPKETLGSCKELDFVAIGEGEYTTLELLDGLARGEPPEKVKGIAFRRGKRVLETPKRPYIEDLDALPFPARHLLPMDKYRILGKNLTVIHVISSRGCPFRCIFCASSALFGKRFRARSVANVLAEIEESLERYKTRNVEFMDDTFTLDRRRVLEFCEEVKRRGLDISWGCSSRVDTITKETMEKMKEAGCSIIFIGVESASQKTLDLIGKGVTVDKAVKVVEWAKEVGIEVLASFVIGFPWETVEDMKRTINFAKKLRPDFVEFSVATPYPGTPLYEWAKKNGFLEIEDWSKYTTIKPVMRGENFSIKEVGRLMLLSYGQFYLSPSFILNQIKRGRWIFARAIPRYIFAFIREVVKGIEGRLRGRPNG